MKNCILFGPTDASANFRKYEPMLRSSTIARSTYREVAEAAGISADQLIDQPAPQIHPVVLRWVRQTAAMLSMARIVEGESGRASVYGGVSLGELAALCMSGAASTDFVLSFFHERHLPDVDRDEAIGFTFVPAPHDWRYYEQPAQMVISVDYGFVFGGAGRMIMVSGLRSALESARDEGPAELQMVDKSDAHQAYHSPFREAGRQRLELLMKRTSLDRLATPVVTAIPGMHTLSSSTEAARALVASETQQLNVPGLIEALHEHYKPDRVYVISSFLRQLELEFHAPTEYVDDFWLTKRFG